MRTSPLLNGLNSDSPVRIVWIGIRLYYYCTVQRSETTCSSTNIEKTQKKALWRSYILYGSLFDLSSKHTLVACILYGLILWSCFEVCISMCITNTCNKYTFIHGIRDAFISFFSFLVAKIELHYRTVLILKTGSPIHTMPSDSARSWTWAQTKVAKTLGDKVDRC